MAVCDLCNGAEPVKRYPASEFQTAAQAGLRPRGQAASIGQAFGGGFDETWLQMVMGDQTDWAVCSSCAAEVDKYLGRG